MMPSETPSPVGSGLPGNPSLLLTSTGVPGERGSVPSLQRNQFSNNLGLLGNVSNASSLLSSSFGNGVPGTVAGLSGPHMNLQQRCGMSAMDVVGPVKTDPLSFTSSSGSLHGQQFRNPNSNQPSSVDSSQSQQMESPQNYQQQFSAPHSQQQQLQSGMGHAAAVKIESQWSASNQLGPQRQLASLHNPTSVKLEHQQLQSMRNLSSVKLEPHQHPDHSLFLQQQQQQQQLLQLSRNSSQTAAQMKLLQQQHMLQLQQQLLKSPPSQRPQLQQQQQHRQLQHTLLRPQVKPAVYKPGMCARRLTHYMYHQQHRPDNSIEYWRKFVKEYFASHAKKRWCVSLYGSGRQTNGVLSQDVWHCELCNHKPGRGFETTVEVFPRLYKIKYGTGTMEELLYVDMPREYQNASGQIVLDYAKAVQESVFEQLRVVREGQLRIVFNSDLKICLWEFCARHHEELIPQKLIAPQVSQLGYLAQKYQVATQNPSSSSSLSSQDFQNTCNSFVASAHQLVKALEVPLINDLGCTKRYVRCLQISEVVNSMKDLIDYSRETATGPIASLINFTKASSTASGQRGQVAEQSEERQSRTQNSNHNDQNSSHTSGMQHARTSNSVMSLNNTTNPTSSTTSTSAIVGLHQSSMNSRQENPISSNMNDPYAGGSTVQIPSASSSNVLPQTPQANGPNPSSPFHSPTPSASNSTAPQAAHGNTPINTTCSPANVSMAQQPACQSSETDVNDAQSSVQQIIQEMMMWSQLNMGSLGNDVKGINGIAPALSGGNSFVDNSIGSNTGMGNMGYGIRPAMNQMVQDTASMNHPQQQSLDNRLLAGGLGKANNFGNLYYDWKTTP